MFQTAELGQSVSLADFKAREQELRVQLLVLQARMRDMKRFPVLIDFAGVSGGGKSTSTNMLNKWMDPRWIQTQGYADPADQVLQLPELWRFWRDLPSRGQIGISLSGRYSTPLLDYVYQRISPAGFSHKLERIKQFEQQLVDDGALVLKFWMHISREVQQQRLQELENDPLQKWKLVADDWENCQNYDRFIEAAEQIISRSNTVHAPWVIIEGSDMNFRHLAVGDILRKALEDHLSRTEQRREFEQRLDEQLRLNGNSSQAAPADRATLFDSLNLDRQVSNTEYDSQLPRSLARLATLHRAAVQRGLSTIVVFEGPDAAGKGGAIRQIAEVLDARTYGIYPTSAPSEDELAHHYLWRFWRNLPRSGRMSIFDRSWYGRVLVERVEGFARPDEWQRAYREINEFEDQLLEHSIVIIKFWLHIDRQEQIRRFEARKEIPWKRWKLTDEDLRNHEKWRDYEYAAHDMIQKTSVQAAPWHVIESQDKQWGRLRILDTLAETLQSSLEKTST